MNSSSIYIIIFSIYFSWSATLSGHNIHGSFHPHSSIHENFTKQHKINGLASIFLIFHSSSVCVCVCFSSSAIFPFFFIAWWFCSAMRARASAIDDDIVNWIEQHFDWSSIIARMRCVSFSFNLIKTPNLHLFFRLLSVCLSFYSQIWAVSTWVCECACTSLITKWYTFALIVDLFFYSYIFICCHIVKSTFHHLIADWLGQFVDLFRISPLK